MDAQIPRRGLGALLQNTSAGAATDSKPDQQSATTVPLNSIRPNPHQPRKDFDSTTISELADSIRSKGVIQPIIVRPLLPAESPGETKYEIIAGERRWRASLQAGLTDVPVIVKTIAGPSDVLLISLIENLQRSDLNPIEEAQAFKRLSDFYSMTHEQISAAVGKSRAVVTNSLRLLDLPESIQDAIRNGRITVGHAKVILGLQTSDQQLSLAARCEAEGLSVRQLEAILGPGVLVAASPSRRHVTTGEKAAHVKEIEGRLSQHLGTKVTVEEGARKGRIVIEFYSVSDFNRITSLIGLTQ